MNHCFVPLPFIVIVDSKKQPRLIRITTHPSTCRTRVREMNARIVRGRVRQYRLSELNQKTPERGGVGVWGKHQAPKKHLPDSPTQKAPIVSLPNRTR